MNHQLFAHVLFTAVLISIAPGVAAGQSFSAHYRYYHQSSETLLDEARVLVSDAGLRVEQTLDGSSNLLIANYESGQYWFVDRQRQIIHEVPFAPVLSSANGRDDEQQHYLPTGFVQFEPCAGLTAQWSGVDRWRGRDVQRWNCLLGDEVAEEQLFALSPAVVVRSIDSNGFIRELVDVHNRPTVHEDFQPPSHFRRVAVEELINPVALIGTYHDARSAPH